MSTTDNSAFLPSVYKNAYQYTDIASSAIVFKETESNFGSIKAPSVDNTYLKATMATDGSVTYSWVNLDIPSYTIDTTGLIASKDGNMYDIDGMSTNSSIYAVQYIGETSTYNGIELPQIAVMPYLNTFETSGFYMIQRDATGGSSGWTLYQAPTSNVTYVYQNTGFVEATPSNLFQLAEAPTSNVMFWYDVSTSEYDTVTLPTTAGKDYILTISNNAPVFIENHASFLLNTSITSDGNKNITDTPISILANDTETIIASHKYNIQCSFDIYINDITQLTTTDTSVTGLDFVNKLPVLTVTESKTSTVIGKYIVKTNQPLQTVVLNNIVIPNTDVTTGPELTVAVEYQENGIPSASPGDSFIQVVPNTIYGTCSL